MTVGNKIAARISRHAAWVRWSMSLLDLSAFGADGTVQVVVESPRGSGLKLKYDPQRGVFTLSRPLIKGLTYPYDWGFVPSTRGPDGDPIDAMVLWDEQSFPGLVLACRLVGALAAEQNSKHHSGTRERNDRLLAVPVVAPRFETIRDVGDVSRRLREELEVFFMASTAFEGKELKLLGWSDASAAMEIVKQSMGG
jgi:inorganic pyrophosphatase